MMQGEFLDRGEGNYTANVFGILAFCLIRSVIQSMASFLFVGLVILTETSKTYW